MLLELVLHFCTLSIVRVVVLQSCAHAEDQMIYWQAIAIRGHHRLGESICRAQLAQRLTADTGHIVLQIWILKASDDLVDVVVMCLCIKPVFADQAVAALRHCRMNDFINLLVSNGFVNGAVALERTQVCRNRMTGIQRKQLAFNISHQIFGQIHTRDFRDFTLERCLFHVPLIVVFYYNVDEVFALNRWDNAVYRAVRETDIFVRICAILFAQCAVNGFLELRACTDCILAGDDVQRLRAALCLTLGDTLCDRRGNARQNNQTNCGGSSLI